jgi:hypothetical protein
MINTKLQNIIDTKSAIGNAIVNKGGTVTSETPFFNYAAQIDGISTGTPQTIFQASDGSKWALTNAVNLVNDAGNVTHDFNYWQPANNSTSDPILNVGTVGANISGNIRLVPVNQVNIAQYVNIVATDNNGAKYEGFNGFDFVTNPTPTGNATFNRWLLNNSATGTVLFANATIVNGGTFNGPNPTANISNMAINANSVNYGSTIRSVTTNNGFIYAGGDTPFTIQKFHESNLVRTANTANYGGTIFSVASNDGFVYAGGGTNRRVQKFFESNLVRATGTNVSDDYGGTIRTISINNGFVYVGGSLSNATIKKYYESNLAFVGNTASVGLWILTTTINNGFIYASGITPNTIQKFYESNLAFVGNTPAYGGVVRSVATNNGFIYAGGETNLTIQKFGEENLAFIQASNVFTHSGLNQLKINNSFIYVAAVGSLGTTNIGIQKYHESNLVFAANSSNYNPFIETITINNGFFYVGGGANIVTKYQEQQTIPQVLTFYTATKIKE